MAKNERGHFEDKGTGPLDSGLAVLFLAAFPMILLLFEGSATTVFAAILQICLFLLALRLIHRGQQIQNAYDAAKTARAPRIPRKLVGSFLIGLMVLILAGHQFVSLWLPLLFGALATGLSITAFGADPMKDKGQVEPERKQASPSSTERALARTAQQLDSLGDPELTRHLEILVGGVSALVATLNEDDPDSHRGDKPVAKFIELLSRENERLIAAWDTGERAEARRRYLARVTALGEAFEEGARSKGAKSGRDAFEIEADLLWSRMRRDRAA